MPLKRFTEMGGDWDIEPQEKDVRGFDVFDAEGNDLGEVQDLLVDTDNDNAVNYALVGKGWLASIFGSKEVIVPLRKLDIDSEDRSVHLDVTRDQLKDFPDYGSLDEPDLRQKVDAFWGTEMYRRPMEGARYARPEMGMPARGEMVAPGAMEERRPEEGAIPVVEERATVEKEREQVGEVSVHKEIETERKPVSAEVTGETVEVEREKVEEKPLAEFEGARKMEAGETISVPVTEERLRVTKEPVVTEMIKLRRRPTTREVTEEVELEKERVEVEEEGPEGRKTA